ncbi:MAG: FAD-dependent oxidoreductase [Verrucomicrobia bacterium]|jgi:NADPH-dependent 2,4-dienoyl-CoA reductase/sulfur reductase-like enzyme/rhodanese-related sulfurtransferase|nr:FAD-dependent oxidoreductase [Verrucomicrobiota bacterium]MBT7068192.1 FAD-dependent oxidoreductase [Verrucomicrobiota bacterium]MBT7701864.1 FAD-dependent oxidoreductase [Verrucomicrobiota bacterium]
MSEPKKIVVVGGSAAGPKAAAKARRMDQHAEVTIIQKGPDLSMASCGYPYYVGGFFDNRNQLLSTPTGVVRDPKFFMAAKGIKALTDTEVIAIDREAKTVQCRSMNGGDEQTVAYDTLVLATGATPIMPPVPGTDLEGITTLQSMRDADYLRQIRDDGMIKKAVVVGGGLIGVETCEALELAGIEITVVEMLPQVLMFLDWEMAKLVENHMRAKGAHIVTENPVAAFLGEDGKLKGVKLKNGTELSCDLAVVATGVRPNSKLAADAGLDVGERGGITVNAFLQTSDPAIYAAGDCIEIPNRITGRMVHAPYGDLANLEGRVVGQNVVKGPTTTFPGTFQTGICKVFDYAAGATGLSERNAQAAGFETVSVVTAAPDKPGFMGGKLLVMKMVAEKSSGKLLGFQAVGPGDVSKRVASAAMALQGGLTIADLTVADLPYAPPFSPAIDNFIATAHVLENKMTGRMAGISSREVKAKVDEGEDVFILDTRGPDEYEQMRLGIGEVLIPLGALRNRMDELPEAKEKEIICFCKISLRGYEAASLLRANGYSNVKVMEGGIMAWPFAREK